MPKYWGSLTDEDDALVDENQGAPVDFSSLDPDAKAPVLVPPEAMRSKGTARQWYLTEGPGKDKNKGLSIPRTTNVGPVEQDEGWEGTPFKVPDQDILEREVRRQGTVAQQARRNLMGATGARAGQQVAHMDEREAGLTLPTSDQGPLDRLSTAIGGRANPILARALEDPGSKVKFPSLEELKGVVNSFSGTVEKTPTTPGEFASTALDTAIGQTMPGRLYQAGKKFTAASGSLPKALYEYGETLLTPRLTEAAKATGDFGVEMVREGIGKTRQEINARHAAKIERQRKLAQATGEPAPYTLPETHAATMRDAAVFNRVARGVEHVAQGVNTAGQAAAGFGEVLLTPTNLALMKAPGALTKMAKTGGEVSAITGLGESSFAQGLRVKAAKAGAEHNAALAEAKTMKDAATASAMKQAGLETPEAIAGTWNNIKSLLTSPVKNKGLVPWWDSPMRTATYKRVKADVLNWGAKTVVNEPLMHRGVGLYYTYQMARSLPENFDRITQKGEEFFRTGDQAKLQEILPDITSALMFTMMAGHQFSGARGTLGGERFRTEKGIAEYRRKTRMPAYDVTDAKVQKDFVKESFIGKRVVDLGDGLYGVRQGGSPDLVRVKFVKPEEVKAEVDPATGVEKKHDAWITPPTAGAPPTIHLVTRTDLGLFKHEQTHLLTEMGALSGSLRDVERELGLEHGAVQDTAGIAKLRAELVERQATAPPEARKNIESQISRLDEAAKGIEAFPELVERTLGTSSSYEASVKKIYDLKNGAMPNILDVFEAAKKGDRAAAAEIQAKDLGQAYTDTMVLGSPQEVARAKRNQWIETAKFLLTGEKSATDVARDIAEGRFDLTGAKPPNPLHTPEEIAKGSEVEAPLPPAPVDAVSKLREVATQNAALAKQYAEMEKAKAPVAEMRPVAEALTQSDRDLHRAQADAAELMKQHEKVAAEQIADFDKQAAAIDDSTPVGKLDKREVIEKADAVTKELEELRAMMKKPASPEPPPPPPFLGSAEERQTVAMDEAMAQQAEPPMQERRSPTRKEFSEMPLEEAEAEIRRVVTDPERVDDLVKFLYKSRRDPLTGAKNLEAWRLDAKRDENPVIVRSDHDKFKLINDNVSHAAGDKVLKDYVEAAHGFGLDIYRIGGDEFRFLFKTPEDASRGMEALRDAIRRNEYVVETPDGVAKFGGVDVSYGIGETDALADAATQRYKDSRPDRGPRFDQVKGRPVQNAGDNQPGAVPAGGDAGRVYAEGRRYEDPRVLAGRETAPGLGISPERFASRGAVEALDDLLAKEQARARKRGGEVTDDALFLISDVRKAADIPKEDFDRQVLKLAEDGVLQLQSHDRPKDLNEAEKDSYIPNGRGSYFIAAGYTQEGLAGRRPADVAPFPEAEKRASESPFPEAETPLFASRQAQGKPLPEMKDNFLKPLGYYTDRLYHEASLERLTEWLPNTQTRAEPGEVFFANTPNLALGQGKNRGVLLELDPTEIKGQVNLSKPGAPLAYQNGEAEFISRHLTQGDIQQALRAITIQKDAATDRVTKRVMSRLLPGLEQVGWTKTETKEGTRYEAPTQIKSATGNRGTFDPENPDIRFASRAAQLPPHLQAMADDLQRRRGIPGPRKRADLGEATAITDALFDETWEMAEIERKTGWRERGYDKFPIGTNPDLIYKDEWDSPVLVAKDAKSAGTENLFIKGVGSGGSKVKLSNGQEAEVGPIILNRQTGKFEFATYVNSQGQTEYVSSLKSILSGMGKDKANRLNDFRQFQHALDLDAAGVEHGTGYTRAEMQAFVDAVRNDPRQTDIVKKSEQLTAYFNSLGDYAVSKGAIDAGIWAALKKRWPHFSPMERLFEQETGGDGAGNKAGTGSPLRKIKGSKRPVVDEIWQAIDRTHRWISQVDRNMAAANLWRMQNSIEGALGGIAEPAKKKHTPLTPAQGLTPEGEIVTRRAKAQGKTLSVDEANQLGALIEPRHDFDKSTSVVSVVVDGKVKELRVDGVVRDFLKALNRVPDAPSNSKTVRALTALATHPTSFLKWMVTGMPAFQMAQLVRDPATGTMQTKGTGGLAHRLLVQPVSGRVLPLVEIARDAGRALGTAFGRVQDMDEARFQATYKRSAGMFSNMSAHDFETKQSVFNEIQDSIRYGSKAGTAIHYLKPGELKWGHFLDNWLDILEKGKAPFESATRKAVARQTLKAGRNDLVAGTYARENTTNFATFGSAKWIRDANRFLPFLNAGLQSSRKFYLTMTGYDPITGKKSPKAAAEVMAKAFLWQTVPTMILWALNKGDDTIEEQRKGKNGLYYNYIRTPNIPELPEAIRGKVVAQPKAFTWSTVFSTIPEAMLDALYEEKPEYLEENLIKPVRAMFNKDPHVYDAQKEVDYKPLGRVAKGLGNELKAGGLSPWINAYLGLKFNVDPFYGGKIEMEHQRKMDAPLRQGYRTGQLSKDLSQGMFNAAEKIDDTKAAEALGTNVKGAVPGPDQIAFLANQVGLRDFYNLADRVYSEGTKREMPKGDYHPVQDLAGRRRFFPPENRGTGFASETFSEIAEKAETAVSSKKQLKKTDPLMLREYIEKRDIGFATAITKLKEKIDGLQQKRAKISQMMTKDPAERKRILDDLTNQIRGFQRRVIILTNEREKKRGAE